MVDDTAVGTVDNIVDDTLHIAMSGTFHGTPSILLDNARNQQATKAVDEPQGRSTSHNACDRQAILQAAKGPPIKGLCPRSCHPSRIIDRRRRLYHSSSLLPRPLTTHPFVNIVAMSNPDPAAYGFKIFHPLRTYAIINNLYT